MVDPGSQINVNRTAPRNAGKTNPFVSENAEGVLSEALNLIGSVQDEFRAKFSGDLILAALSDKDLTKLSKFFDKQYEKLHEITLKLPEVLEEQSGMIAVNQAIQNSIFIPKAALNILAGLASHPSDAVRQAAGKAIPDVTRILKKFIEVLLKLGNVDYAQELVKFIKTVTSSVENNESTEGANEISNFEGENENQALTTQILASGFEQVGNTYGQDSSGESGINDEIEDAISGMENLTNRPNKNKKNKIIAEA